MWYARDGVPLVDVQVRGHVGGQASGGRRSSHWLQGEVVGASLLHAHVPEVETLRSQAVCSKQSLRGQVASVAPRARNWRRAHGGERRGHLHSGGGGVWWLLCWATIVETSVCGRSSSLPRRRNKGRALATGVQSISIQDKKTNSNLKMLAVNSLKLPGCEVEGSWEVTSSKQT